MNIGKISASIIVVLVAVAYFSIFIVKEVNQAIVLRFGDPKMGINRDDPEARKNFRARHNCDQKKDKTTAGYWSCYQWRAGSKVDN